jgi:transketolase
MRDHFIKTLTGIAAQDKNIILITGDLGFGVLNDFEEQFPSQYINAGVAEQNMTGLATGLGMSGKTVFTYSIGNFCTLRCLEQIRNDACYHEANVNIVSIGGGFSYGALGYSHHATEDIAIMRALPNIKIFSPSDFWETEEITKYVASNKGVHYLRLDKSSAGRTNKEGEVFKPGVARVVREGSDFTIFATGGILEEALKAATTLQSEGIECRVVSIHTIKPIDEAAIIAAANETGGILSLEEHTIHGGLGSAISEVLMDNNIYPKKFHRMALRNGFSTIVGSQHFLREQYGLNADSVSKKIKSLLQGNS